MSEDFAPILNNIAQTIYDKKGFNILVLDVRGVSTLTDYFVIAEGNIDRHVKAISQAIQHEMKNNRQEAWHVEGDSSSDWVVLDYVDIVIHLMTPEMREKYALEKLWHQAKIVDVQIKIHENAGAGDYE